MSRKNVMYTLGTVHHCYVGRVLDDAHVHILRERKLPHEGYVEEVWELFNR